MGRGRGRGRKQLTNGRTHEDKGSSGGEEVVVPARKRRGRPQKRVATEKIIQAEVKKLEADDGDEDYMVGAGDGAKLKGSRTEHASGAGNNKRNRVLKEEEGSNLANLDIEENSSSTRSSNDESTRSNGFRQSGSRRKSTPRRAAEAGL